MKVLHDKQKKILELLVENKDSPLTITRLMEILKIDSPGVFYYHLDQLEKRGYLKRNPNNSKDYFVLEKPENSVVYLPKYGMAQCGADGIMLDDNIVEQVPIASSLLRFAAKDAFIVQAKGNCMKPRIEEGDIVIAKQQDEVDNGEMIVCSHNMKAMIKVFYKLGNIVSLNSLNIEDQKPIIVKEDDNFKIAGVVKHILKY
ncbi:MAG TPA: S24 family peptidase [Nitrosopumilaceae archaeon]|nr:S24 family peptidase [Nitrosopumilaceae archaeon]